MQNWSGIGVAIVTPFDKDGHIDFTSFKQHIDYLADGGVDYIVVLGSTGEAHLQSYDEHRKLLDTAIAHCNGRIPIVAGVFASNNTDKLCKRIKAFDFKGVDGILSCSPEYVKPTQEGIIAHFSAIAECSPVPIITYGVPSRTGSNIAWDTAVKLSKINNLVGIKDASADMIQATKIAANIEDGFVLLSGDDETALPLVAVGGHGVISVIGNVYPKAFKAMIDAARNNDYTRARMINDIVYPLHKHLYAEGNPTGIKKALVLRGIIATANVRLPLLPLSDKETAAMQQTIKDIDASLTKLDLL